MWSAIEPAAAVFDCPECGAKKTVRLDKLDAEEWALVEGVLKPRLENTLGPKREWVVELCIPMSADENPKSKPKPKRPAKKAGQKGKR